MARPRALILDYGNVLTFPQAPDIIEAMASRLGATVEAFTAGYWEHRHGYDLGEYTAHEYWGRVVTSLHRRAVERNELALLDWLTARDADSWMRYREPVWDIARSVRAGRMANAMLSNMSRELAARIGRDRPLERWFDAVIISAEVRCVKPDPRLYRLCLARLGVDPAEALFVDDRTENVRAAAALGMQTLHFRGEADVAVLGAAMAEGR